MLSRDSCRNSAFYWRPRTLVSDARTSSESSGVHPPLMKHSMSRASIRPSFMNPTCHRMMDIFMFEIYMPSWNHIPIPLPGRTEDRHGSCGFGAVPHPVIPLPFSTWLTKTSSDLNSASPFLSTCNFLATQSAWNSKVLAYLQTYNCYLLLPYFWKILLHFILVFLLI